MTVTSFHIMYDLGVSYSSATAILEELLAKEVLREDLEKYGVPLPDGDQSKVLGHSYAR